MRVAITGANGFVGRHVTAALLARGVEVVTVVRGNDAPARSDGAEQVQLDICAVVPEDFVRLGCPDAIIHLAWGGLPDYTSLHHFERELPAHYGFCRTMVEAGAPALLITGTCYEYGMTDGRLDEQVEATPANPYALAKTTLRRQLEFLQQKQSFALTWARLFYTYGTGQAPTSIWPLLTAAVARGDAVFPMSMGEQLRDYLPVSEIADTLAELAMRREGAGIVNICSGKPVSIRNLVERWIVDNGWSIKLDLGRYPYPTYEPLAFWGHRGKLDRLLAGAATSAER